MTEPSVRIDVWLWAARWFKTRSLAKQAIDAGRIELNGRPSKPAKELQPGDRLRITRGEERCEVEVLALSEQRGPATTAATLYRETDASAAARAAQREQRRLVGRPHPPTRPDRQARRALQRLKDPAR